MALQSWVFPSKRVAQKTVVATGNLIGNKIADKITVLNKAKSKTEIPLQEINIPLEKVQQIVDDLKLIYLEIYKNEISKIYKPIRSR